jgi:uncharacterized protein (TIGR02145 family)
MKRILRILALAAAVIPAVLLASCTKSGDDNAVTGVKLDKYELPLVIGQTATLTATVTPDAAPNKGVTWKSSNTAIATVDAEGLVRAIAEGNAVVTVTTDEGGKTASCVVKVEATGATGAALDKPKAMISLLETLQLRVVMEPEIGTDNSATWKSSNPAVATVDANGLVTPVSIGKADIIATTRDGGFKPTCALSVTEIGTISFRSDRTWKVGDFTWSDVVMGSGCRKTTYNGGDMALGQFKADCRENTGEYGDLFSWQAVSLYRFDICPEGWHIPHFREFANLDKALGGAGVNFQQDVMLINKYLTLWGADFSGSVDAVNDLYNQDTHGFYWSLSSADSYFGNCLTIINTGEVSAQDEGEKNNGYAVRCVQGESIY